MMHDIFFSSSKLAYVHNIEYLYMVYKSLNTLRDKKYNSVIFFIAIYNAQVVYAPMFKKFKSVSNFFLNFNQTNVDSQLICKCHLCIATSLYLNVLWSITKSEI